MFRNRLVSLVLCFTLIVACLPVFSLSASADNSGFCQIRIFYKESDSLGNFGTEKSAIITDNSALQIATHNMLRPIQITRFLVRNDGNATAYFQFDLNIGGQIPVNGAYPTSTYTSLNFTTNGGVTAYSFATTDQTSFFYFDRPNTNYGIALNSAANRTFFGKVDSSGYITFNNPVTITFNQNDSPGAFVYLFFRHLVIGYDNSQYLANLENTINHIDDNVDNIAGWMEEEHNLFDNAWNSGGSEAYSDYSSNNSSFFSTIRDLFGFSIFGGLWRLDIFSQSNSFFSNWFSQTNADNINGSSNKKSPEETEFVNFYEDNLNGNLDIFGIGVN